MEFEKLKSNPNPFTRANILSKLFFWWLTPLFLKGAGGNLKLTDLYDCPDADSSEKLGGRLQKEWDKELKKLESGKEPSLVWATIRAFGLEYCLNSILAVIEECFTHIMQPVMLGYLIEHFRRSSVLPYTQLYLTAVGFCLLSALYIFTHHPYFFNVLRMGMWLRIACCSLLYKKALRLSQAALGKTTVGQMVNLLSNDVNRFDQSVLFFPYLIVGPLQSAIIVYILWSHIGFAGLAAISVLTLFIPFQSLMGKLFSKFRMKTAVLTDERIRLMNELTAGMRVIKMYGWETPFAKLVDLSRRKEIQMIRKTSILKGINMAVFFISARAILLLAFIVFVLGVKGDLTPEKVFVCMALFNNIDLTMSLFFPLAISQGAESLISLKRIQKFLLLEEQSETCRLDASNLRPKLNHCGIWLNRVVATWSEEGEATLHNVTLSVEPGELLAVVGPVGCGKTSLLMALLGELPIKSGEVKVRGRAAYASQEPWVFSGSIRQNILFGSRFDEDRYREVLTVCALDKDIQMFPYGDQTLVGERGVSLSGGQKARVNLARAMYFDADVFLLDDPLSAVDSSVSKHLFEKCINGYLKDKVRILATHQIQFLKQASNILVLKDGGCLAFGTYDNLINAGVDLGSLMDDEQERRLRVASTTSTASSYSSMAEDIADSALPLPMFESTLSINSTGVGDHDEKGAWVDTSGKAPKQADESKSSGSVSLKVYVEYVKSGAGPILRLVILFLILATQALSSGSDFWLTTWTNLEQKKSRIRACWAGANKTFLDATGFYESGFDRRLLRDTWYNVSDDCFEVTGNYTQDVQDAGANVDMEFHLSVYSGMVVAIFFMTFLKTTTFFEMCMRSSVTLHEKMFKSVLRSPVAFFDSNPVGRVLTRFSKDTGIIDELLPMSGIDTFQCIGSIIGIVIVVAIVEPYLLLPTAFITAIFIAVRRFYLPTMRDVKRYEGITRSPVFSHLSTSLYGLTTIRAFRVQRSFEVAFDQHQDRHTATWFLFMCVTRWLAITLDWLSFIYISSVTIAMVVLSEDPSFASKAGLAIASSLQLAGNFQWGVRQSSEVESQMTSVERVLEYSRLKSEASLDSDPDQKPPKDWPSKGHIVYHNVSLQYNPKEPPVLKKLSFEIYPEEKIGIVGRTGAGKSSMIATLFRMTEPEGEVKVDGVSTKNIGLHDLRKKISIIPQDPVLFTGPVRRNLDPFGEHNDSELWKALGEAYLKEAIEELPGGLDAQVSEGGNNFSVGQRQLICLARAILRRNRILVLDEATANVDPNTDSLIQETIRDGFAHCTVLTIAHRLHTIMDSDRVLVLDAGEVKEFDKPYTLLQDPTGYFTEMVKMTGPSMERQLREVARTAHLKKETAGENKAVLMANGSSIITANNVEDNAKRRIGNPQTTHL